MTDHAAMAAEQLRHELEIEALAGSYIAGKAARALGEPATSNPHNEWAAGVAWAAGWHRMDFNEYVEAGIGDLVRQNREFVGKSAPMRRAVREWRHREPLL